MWRNGFVLLVGLMLLFPKLSDASPMNPNLRTMLTMFGPKVEMQTAWLAKRFDFFNGGAENPRQYNPAADLVTYKDSTVIMATADIAEEQALRSFIESRGGIYEDSLLHMSVDYQVTANPPWTGMDQFDTFERTPNVGPTKGVWVYENNTYSDKTTAAYKGIGGVPINDTLYLGYGVPFDQANFVLTTTAISVIVAWEYWDGKSWVSLSVVDGTGMMTRNGRVSFTPPANWGRTSVNGSYNKWWIRARITGGLRKPVATTIKGDDWRSTTLGTNCRGWDSKSPTIINSGDLAYNPTPPAGATAKFKYQSRATGMWAANYYMPNPDYQVNGDYFWASYLANGAITSTAPENGLMLDDTTVWPNISSPANAVTTYTEVAGKDLFALKVAHLSRTYSLIKQRRPDYLVGGNIYHTSFFNAVDFAWDESAWYAFSSGSAGIVKSTANPYLKFDDALTLNNPTGRKAYMVAMDTMSNSAGRTSSPATGPLFWDRANRGPLAALSLYYIASNENTGFGYNPNGRYYTDRDDYVYFDGFTTTLSVPLTADPSRTAKIVKGADFSGFPASGYEVMSIGAGDTTDIITNGSLVVFTKIDNNTLSVALPIYFNHSAGETIRFGRKGRQFTDILPPLDRIVRWGQFFPAMAVDLGAPNATGYNGGTRDFNWTLGSAIGGGQNIWRRDFARAMVLHRPSYYNTSLADYVTRSAEVALGGTYYPLKADGTTAPGISSIGLRHGEGAILMKAPISSGPLAPSPSSDTTAPSTSISVPGTQLSGTVTLNANASDNVGIAKVEFYIGGTLRFTATTAPYAYVWNTTSLADGTYTLFTKAYDMAGNIGQSSISMITVKNSDAISPTAVITTPVSGATVRGTTTVNVTANDNVAVARVELFINGKLFGSKTSAPYSFAWNSGSYPLGPNSLFAIAYDAAGNKAQSIVVGITVLDSVSPVVTVASPLNNAKVYSSFTVKASATDNAAVVRMTVLVDGTIRATSNSNTLNWIASQLASGRHTITVNAYDAAGNTAGKTVTVYR